MTALTRLPLQIVRTGASLGLELARFVERRVRGGDEERAAPPASRPSPSSPTTARTPAARPTPAKSPEQAAREAAPESPTPLAAPEPAEPQPEFAERHLDTADEQVASFGPATDAGATITVAAPWSGYDDMGAASVVERVRASDDTTKALVLLYERQGKNRKTVLAAAGGGPA